MATEQVAPEQANAALFAHMRKNFLAFCAYVLPSVGQWDLPIPAHIREMGELCQDIADGVTRRAIVTVCPQHGKSTLIAQAYAAWWLANNPDKHVLIGAYDVELAKRNTRFAKRIVQCERFQNVFPGIQIASDLGAVDYWGLEGYAGSYRAVSVKSGTTGYTAHLLLLDDPHKDRKEAASEAIRDDTFGWFLSEFLTRGKPDPTSCPVLVIHTRFHPEDVTGKLLADNEDGTWRHLHLPAISAEGKPLWYPLEVYEEIRDKFSDPQSWAALWLGDPMATTGEFFTPEMFPVETVAPKFSRLVRHWDLAISKRKSGDFTTSALVGVDDERNFWILHVTKDKLSFPEVKAKIMAMAKIDGPAVTISLPDDVLGTSLYTELEPAMVGRPFFPFREKYAGGKEARAALWQSKGHSGRLRLLKGVWNHDFVKEALAFPRGKHDDQVDAVSGAVHQAARFSGGTEKVEELPPNQSWAYMLRLKAYAAEDREEREAERDAA